MLGAVGLDHFDLDERRDTSPWVTGMIVRAERRGEGIGRALMQFLEQWAFAHGIGEAWVGTEQAAGFYERCGWTRLETFTSKVGERIDDDDPPLRPDEAHVRMLRSTPSHAGAASPGP